MAGTKPTNDKHRVKEFKTFWFSKKKYVEVYDESQDVFICPKDTHHLVKNPRKRKGKVKSEL